MKGTVRPTLVGVGVTVLLLIAVACAPDPKPAGDGVGAVEPNGGATPAPTSTLAPTSTPIPTSTLAPTSTPIPTSAPASTSTLAPTSGRSFTLGTDKNPNRFTWVSGTNADATVPPDSDGDPSTKGDKDNINLWPLVVRAGEAVSFTFKGIGETHRVAIYPPTNPDGCLAGFCEDDLFSFDDLEPGGTVLLTFKWPTAGEAVYLVCNEHSGIMRTTIKVIP